MCKFNEEELQKKFDECNARSEEELMQELSEADIDSSDFDNFREMITPMLSPQQIEKLNKIMQTIKKE